MASKAQAEKKKADPVETAAAQEALQAFEQFAELGPGIEVQISREPGSRYLEILPLDGLDLELMRERYGGGKFSLRARQDGRWVKGVSQRRVEIEGPPKPFPPPEVQEQQDPGKALREELAKLQGAAPATSETMMVAMMTTLSTVLTTVLQASLERRPETTAAEMFQLAREFAKETGARGGGDGFDPVTTLGLPLLAELREMRKLQASAPAGALPNPGSASTTGNGKAPAMPQTTAQLAEFMARWCRPHAERGANPQLRAEVFLEDLELENPALYASVVELSRLAGILDHWVALAPVVAEHREWHGEFIAAVRDYADDSSAPDSDPPAPERGPGDDGDAPHDGAARAGGSEG